MKPRKRRVKLAAWGSVLISAAGVAGIVFPRQADLMAKLAFAIAGLFGSISYAMGMDDQAEAVKASAASAAPSEPAPPQ